jgi:DNA-binding NarL/FixJ family response regulator
VALYVARTVAAPFPGRVTRYVEGPIGAEVDELIFARVHLGDAPPLGAPSVERALDHRHVTDAERAVVGDLVCALSHGEIAKRRKRSVRTVANQVSSIYKKLRVSDRNELIGLLRAT